MKIIKKASCVAISAFLLMGGISQHSCYAGKTWRDDNDRPVEKKITNKGEKNKANGKSKQKNKNQMKQDFKRYAGPRKK